MGGGGESWVASYCGYPPSPGKTARISHALHWDKKVILSIRLNNFLVIQSCSGGPRTQGFIGFPAGGSPGLSKVACLSPRAGQKIALPAGRTSTYLSRLHSRLIQFHFVINISKRAL